MRLVAEEYASSGWIVTDVSMQNLGWDLSVTSGNRVEHLVRCV
jgi:hypothetical protein